MDRWEQKRERISPVSEPRGYTTLAIYVILHRMKQQRIVVLLLLILAGLAACSPGHLGSNEIAFIRGGQLWTIDPDGANAFAIVAQNVPVVGYSWSPTHQLLMFRTIDGDFAKTKAASQLTHNSITGQITDIPSTINTVGIDGGTPISLAYSSTAVSYSNAFWNTNGTRLLYRATALPEATTNPLTSNWWVSQNDQPAGIAAKPLPDSYTIPSVSYASQNYLVVENSNTGVFTLTMAGTDQHYIIHGQLPGHPLSATLERILWQPGQQDHRILYASATNSAQVQLVLRDIHGQAKIVATCACEQFAWSPDGQTILYSTGKTYTLVNVKNATSFSINGDQGSVPYWSPDSHFLLLDGAQTLILANSIDKQYKTLLSDGKTTSEQEKLPGRNELLQPLANNLWANDSRHFLFQTRDRLQWQGKMLRNGLYALGINAQGQLQGDPDLVDDGKDSQPGWSYEDANTSFLF